MNKVLCIYHSNCTDGFGAAWAVRRALGEGVEFYPGQYGEAPPDVFGRDVVIVDFSYKRDVLLEMAQTARRITILDHHKSAAEDLMGIDNIAPKITVVFDMDRSGAGLTWDYFHRDTPRPELINHIEDRDLWRFNLPGTKAVAACLFSYPYDFDVWDKLMSTPIEELALEGEAILRKQEKDIERLIESSTSRMSIVGYDVPCVNTALYISEIGNILSKGEPFAVCYYDTATRRHYSLRSSENGLDVSEIAKHFGGGGHRAAAGFSITHEALNSMIAIGVLKSAKKAMEGMEIPDFPASPPLIH